MRCSGWFWTHDCHGWMHRLQHIRTESTVLWNHRHPLCEYLSNISREALHLPFAGSWFIRTVNFKVFPSCSTLASMVFCSVWPCDVSSGRLLKKVSRKEKGTSSSHCGCKAINPTTPPDPSIESWGYNVLYKAVESNSLQLGSLFINRILALECWPSCCSSPSSNSASAFPVLPLGARPFVGTPTQKR